jgi:RNA polymerase sigma factor (TIGR02999 family)
VDRKRILDQILPVLYRELKKLARSQRYRWQGTAKPGTTSLVHEAYARLAHQSPSGFENRRQFLCVASKAMRSILIDNARFHRRQKRGSGERPVPLDETLLVSAERSEELLALDDALESMGASEPGLAQVVECRTFGGLTIDETGFALDISPATVKRRWNLALAYLYREMRTQPS